MKSPLPWLNYHLVRVIYVSVGLLPVDVLQNINARDSIPLRQVKLATWLKDCIGKDMVLNKEHPCLQDGKIHVLMDAA